MVQKTYSRDSVRQITLESADFVGVLACTNVSSNWDDEIEDQSQYFEGEVEDMHSDKTVL